MQGGTQRADSRHVPYPPPCLGPRRESLLSSSEQLDQAGFVQLCTEQPVPSPAAEPAGMQGCRLSISNAGAAQSLQPLSQAPKQLGEGPVFLEGPFPAVKHQPP